MGKHSSAEDKLHISPSLRSKNKLPVQKLKRKDMPRSAWPPKGTNANNQFM